MVAACDSRVPGLQYCRFVALPRCQANFQFSRVTSPLGKSAPVCVYVCVCVYTQIACIPSLSLSRGRCTFGIVEIIHTYYRSIHHLDYPTEKFYAIHIRDWFDGCRVARRSDLIYHLLSRET